MTLMKRFAVAAALTVAAASANAAATASPAKVDATKMALRSLWVDHVFWARNYVVAHNDGDKKAEDEAANQVVANAKAIAGAIEPFYGKAASDQLLSLLAGHWGAVKDIEDASKAKDQKKRDQATANLTANAKEIAKFLSGANPNLPYDTLVSLLSTHGAHHIAQIDQLRNKDYASEAQTWAAMRDHMHMIADALADGIAKQFPDKF
jgi:hypothetical protein